MYGVLKSVPANNAAPGNMELQVDYMELIGAGQPGGTDTTVTAESDVDRWLDNRHLVLRGDNVSMCCCTRPRRHSVLRRGFCYFCLLVVSVRRLIQSLV